MKEAGSRGRGMVIFKMLPLALTFAVGIYGGSVLATPGAGVTSKPLGKGTLEPIDVKMKSGEWELEVKTEGLSDLSVGELKFVPGGHSGWHSHPGPSLVIVRSGTLSFYRGDDPGCTAHVFPAGTAFVDPGGVTHIARNEGTEELVLVTTRLVASGATPTNSEPNPGNCAFRGF